MKAQFLNNHPILEKKLLNTEDDPGVNSDHVIIDKEDWIEAIGILDTIRESPKVLDFMDDVSTKKILDAIRPTQFKKAEENNSGLKYDCNKPRFDLIPADALEEVAKLYTIGANKYGVRNWELGMSYGRLFGALMRHAWGWWKGERDDKDNKLHHLSAVIFNAAALLHYELNLKKFKEFDDRNIKIRSDSTPTSMVK